MRHLPALMQAHLDSGATTLCHCWRVARRDGVVLGFTDHDARLGFDNVFYLPGSGFDTGGFDAATGLAPDNAEVVGALSADAITRRDLEGGLYDDAEVDVYLVNWRDTNQRVLLFRGSIGETVRGALEFRAELRGMSHRLGQPNGRAFLRQCDAALGDARCGLVLAPVAGAVAAVESDGGLLLTGIEGASRGNYAEGTLLWTSGANAGLSTQIRAQDGSRVSLWSAPPLPVAVGDAVSLTPGCDKRFETCRDRFANTLNFRGFPTMPGDDWITRYPREAGLNDGGVLS